VPRSYWRLEGPHNDESGYGAVIRDT
jgi:hypothetical protein